MVDHGRARDPHIYSSTVLADVVDDDDKQLMIIIREQFLCTHFSCIIFAVG